MVVVSSALEFARGKVTVGALFILLERTSRTLFNLHSEGESLTYVPERGPAYTRRTLHHFKTLYLF